MVRGAPVLPHRIHAGGYILASAAVPLAWIPIGVALDDGQWVVQRPRNLDSLAILLDIPPLMSGLGRLAGCVVTVLMSPLQMLLDVRRSYTILARAADDDLQAEIFSNNWFSTVQTS
ncbi:hypothetical protein BJY01DRAFT_209758 [Aspergillus pseudoustus]|uniref:Uncharacterized protein n=1 Tax=Aspergillus pseudoustus TaxID=1810923 RepID=A0ABR4KHA6_9EURO